ncbi:hypothetical protein [Bacillus pinisoli]|uniref:hypothetical protein n=1 Tax=Bacillus pinisoli TaxID=2901866 RepID=UPI001FF121C8
MESFEHLRQTGGVSINDIHDEALIEHFVNGIGRRAFLLTPAFPFLFIGTIKDVVEDLLVMDVETTHIAQLENREWHIHIDSIEVFFIERDNGPRIPNVSD